jgi:hypothetical protein
MLFDRRIGREHAVGREIETPLPLPNSITESVLHGEAAEAAPAGSKPKRGGSTPTIATAG